MAANPLIWTELLFCANLDFEVYLKPWKDQYPHTFDLFVCKKFRLKIKTRMGLQAVSLLIHAKNRAEQMRIYWFKELKILVINVTFSFWLSMTINLLWKVFHNFLQIIPSGRTCCNVIYSLKAPLFIVQRKHCQGKHWKWWN